MIFYKKILSILILLIVNTVISFTNVFSTEVNIVMKINNEIITNIDVENEYKYLVGLNKSLDNINKKTVLDLAKNSLKKEIIKKIELEKIYELNQKNDTVNSMVSNIYKNLGFATNQEFKNYLKSP